LSRMVKFLKNSLVWGFFLLLPNNGTCAKENPTFLKLGINGPRKNLEITLNFAKRKGFKPKKAPPKGITPLIKTFNVKWEI